VPLLPTVTTGWNPPKFTVWLGSAARDPAGGTVVLGVGAPAARVVVVRAVRARSRTAWSPKMVAGSCTGSPQVRPPSVEAMTVVMLGAALGAVNPGRRVV